MKLSLNHLFNNNPPISAEILCIGSELILGNIVNTNSQWISEELTTLGINHFRQTTIGDNLNRITKLIQEISCRCNLLITTGGLGPTPDDLTTEAISRAFESPLFLREYLWNEIQEKLSHKKELIENVNLRKQCLFPKGVQIINNPTGTAPGMIWQPINNFTIMTFPGVPSELKSMWKESAKDYIKNKFSDGSIFYSNTLKLTGISESTISKKIEELLNLRNPTVAPYANLEEVKLRITAKAKNNTEAKLIIRPIKDKLKVIFSDYIFGEDDHTLASIVIDELKNKNQTIVFAESCTGGLLSSTITSVGGSSKVFKGGVVAYSNELKESLLNVPSNLIAIHGAVSEEVASAMAIGIKDKLKSDWSISISGIAGPEGGSNNKPVGLVYIAITGPDKKTTIIKKQYNSLRNRIEIQRLSVNDCLNSLRLILLSNK